MEGFVKVKKDVWMCEKNPSIFLEERKDGSFRGRVQKIRCTPDFLEIYEKNNQSNYKLRASKEVL